VPTTTYKEETGAHLWVRYPRETQILQLRPPAQDFFAESSGIDQLPLCGAPRRMGAASNFTWGKTSGRAASLATRWRSQPRSLW